MNLIDFRKNLKTELKQRNLSLNSFVQLSDLSEDTLRSVIYGDSEDTKLSTLIKIADVFQCSLDGLVGRQYYSKKELRILDRIHKLPIHSLDIIQTVITIEYNCLLQKSKNNKDVLPLFIPNGNLRDGMYYNGSSYEILDTTAYPESLKRDCNFALKITTNNFEPICFVNDVILFTTKYIPRYYDVVLYVNSSGKLFIRRYTELGLEPINRFGDIILTNEINDYTPLGVVLKVVREFDIERYR